MDNQQSAPRQAANEQLIRDLRVLINSPVQTLSFLGRPRNDEVHPSLIRKPP
jgi:hypothetical protein